MKKRLLLAALIAGLGGMPAAAESILLQSTTSTSNSGLYDENPGSNSAVITYSVNLE